MTMLTTEPAKTSSTKIDLNFQKIDGTARKAVKSFINEPSKPRFFFIKELLKFK